MKILLQLHEGRPISIALPQQAVLEVWKPIRSCAGRLRRPDTNPPNSKTDCAWPSPPSSSPARKIVVSTTDGAYVRRAE